MVLILHIIHNLLRKIDAQAAWSTLLQGASELRIGFLCKVEGIDIKIGQDEEHSLVFNLELDGDVVWIGWMVLDSIREEFVNREIKRTSCIIVDLFLSTELVDELENLC